MPGSPPRGTGRPASGIGAVVYPGESELSSSERLAPVAEQHGKEATQRSWVDKCVLFLDPLIATAVATPTTEQIPSTHTREMGCGTHTRQAVTVSVTL